MIEEILSLNLSRALSAGSQSTTWSYPDALLAPPDSAPGVGTVELGGVLSQSTVKRLFLIPYLHGTQYDTMNFRLYGWRGIDFPNNPPYQQQVWLPYLIAEFACIASTRSGAPNNGLAPTQWNLSDTQRTCDSITLTAGALGLTGYVVSAPDSNMTGSVLIEIGGAKFVTFDFQADDPKPMNLLWTRA